MINIIFLILAGSAFVYIAKDNLEPVSLTIAQFTFSDIPLFYVIVGSLLLGLAISSLFQMVASISSSLALRNKSKMIKTSEEEIVELTKRIHQLELENEKLKQTEPQAIDPNAL